MADEIIYDRGDEKWQYLDIQTGELKELGHGKDGYFMANIEPLKDLNKRVGFNTLGFFLVILGYLRYENRIYINYDILSGLYGLSSATIRKHLSILESHNIILRKSDKNEKRYYLVNGGIVFRGNSVQRDENLQIFMHNAMRLLELKI